MLDLEPRVHLQEEEPPVGAEEELDGSGADVSDGLRSPDRRITQFGSQRGRHRWRGRLLDDLLVPPLDRALPLAERPHGAVRVREDLHLDVASCLDVRLAEDGRVAERGRRLAPRRLHGTGEVSEVPHDPHATATTAGRRLDQQRQVVRRDRRRVEFREYRHAGVRHQLLRGDLGSHRFDRLGRRPDPGEAGVDHGTRERGVLRQEPVPGVDGVGAGRLGGVQQQVGAQVRVAGRVAGKPHRDVTDVRRTGVRVGVDAHRRDAQRMARTGDPAGDLAAVGHQKSVDHGALTSGRRRSHGRPQLVHCGSPRGRAPGRYGCRAGR